MVSCIHVYLFLGLYDSVCLCLYPQGQQVAELQAQVAELQAEVARLHDIETKHTELQVCVWGGQDSCPTRLIPLGGLLSVCCSPLFGDGRACREHAGQRRSWSKL